MKLKLIKQYKINNNSFEDLSEMLNSGSRPGFDFYILMFLSAVIASFGLLQNNTAVVIGAMLIAPLIDPILGLSFSSLIRNKKLALQAFLTLLSGILLVIFVGWIIGTIFSSLALTSEILGRTKPDVLDLFIALAAGFLGGLLKVRKSISGSLPGVAISISLVPPLCVIGIGLAHLKEAIFLGALLLFITNLSSILFTSLLAFLLSGYIKLKDSAKAFILPFLAITALCIPLAYQFIAELQETQLKQQIVYLLHAKTFTFRYLQIVNTEINTYQNPISVNVTIRAPKDAITPKQVGLVQDYLSKKIQHPIHLVIILTPVEQIEAP